MRICKQMLKNDRANTKTESLSRQLSEEASVGPLKSRNAYNEKEVSKPPYNEEEISKPPYNEEEISKPPYNEEEISK